MSQRGGGKGFGGGVGVHRTSRKKTAVSYVIRDVQEKLNRSGVNGLAIDPLTKHLYTAGRDSIIRCWNISQCTKQKQCVSSRVGVCIPQNVYCLYS